MLTRSSRQRLGPCNGHSRCAGGEGEQHNVIADVAFFLGCFHFVSYTVLCFCLGRMKVADYFPLTEGDQFVFHVSLADVKVSKVNSC